MLHREKLIAVISSGDLHPGAGEGYELVVTDSRIVGAPRPAATGIPEPYLWSVTGSSEADRAEADRAAAGIVGRGRFNFSKESIYKILYDAPGLFFGGRLKIESVGERLELAVSSFSAWNPGSVFTVRTLVGSLLLFAPEKLYDEKTGALVRDKARPH